MSDFHEAAERVAEFVAFVGRFPLDDGKRLVAIADAHVALAAMTRASDPAVKAALLHLIRRGNCPMFRQGRSVDCAAGHGPCSDDCLPILREWAKREALTDTPDTCPTCGWPTTEDAHTLPPYAPCPACGLIRLQYTSDEGTSGFVPYQSEDAATGSDAETYAHLFETAMESPECRAETEQLAQEHEAAFVDTEDAPDTEEETT